MNGNSPFIPPVPGNKRRSSNFLRRPEVLLDPSDKIEGIISRNKRRKARSNPPGPVGQNYRDHRRIKQRFDIDSVFHDTRKNSIVHVRKNNACQTFRRRIDIPSGCGGSPPWSRLPNCPAFCKSGMLFDPTNPCPILTIVS